MNLRELQSDEVGIISAVNIGGALGVRIREMGLIPGTEIMIVGRAPLYDPVKLRINGQTLTLRNNEVDYIEVRRAEGALQ